MDTVTSITLLEGLRDEDDAVAWRRFIDRYQPMVISFARKIGLGAAQSQDAAQETMLAFMQGYRERRFDHSKGRLRSWLFGIARRKVADLKRERAREVPAADRPGATDWLESLESPDDAHAVWEREWQRSVLRACLDEVRCHVNPTTLSAFELYVFEDWPVDRVADHLSMTPNAVYIAKTRVLAHIREIRAAMEEVW